MEGGLLGRGWESSFGGEGEGEREMGGGSMVRKRVMVASNGQRGRGGW